ncbi:MAG: hemolysin family protein [Planctomycetaceae bacterium]|nr:hemolysin family protein [Planctomycetaceae bacterium]
MGLIELGIIVALVGLNGFFAGYEIALASVTVARLRVLVKENRAGARAALYMKENMEASLAAVQVAVTLLAAVAAAIGGAGANEKIEPFLYGHFHLSHGTATVLALAIVVVPLTMLTILFGELAPKVFSLRNKEWVCLRLSRPMRWFCFSVWPAVWLFEICVTTMMAWSERRWRPRIQPGVKIEAAELLELRAQAASARASRLIGEREEGIILGAARFSSRTVGEIMLPAEYISMLGADASLEDSLVAAHLEMHTRFPVAERPGDPASILGYVNFKDLVSLMRLSRPHEASLRAVLRPLPSLTAEMKLATCLERLIREHTHIALVRDASGKVEGMITLEDVLEELVGEIQDEYDRLPVHVMPAGWAWVAGGGISLERLKEQTGVDLAADPPLQPPEGGVRNLSDWIVGHLGGHFRSGDVLVRPGLRVVVRKVRRQKVFEAQVERVDAPRV